MGLVGWRQYCQILTVRNFVDEQDNFLIGSYINSGAKLYREAFSHHQPMAYLLSAGIQKITRPNTLYTLILRHREFVIVWSLAWWLWLILRTGWKGFGLGLMFELIKISYQGNLFLIENIVVYPLLYGLSLLLKKDISKFDLLISGIIWAFITWSLAPLWPIVGIVGLVLIIKMRKQWKNLGWLLLGALLVTGIVWSKVDFKGYIAEPILANSKYYIGPQDGISVMSMIFESILTPIKVWQSNTDIAKVLNVYMVTFFASLLWIIWKRKFKFLIILLILLALLNLRQENPIPVDFGGFHILPWLAVILGSTWWILGEAAKKTWLVKTMVIIILGLNLGLTVKLVWPELTKKTDFAYLYDIYYSRSYNMSMAIKSVAGENDRLLVIADEPNWYWQSGVKSASRFIFFFKWMDRVNDYHNEIISVMDKNKPEFLRYDGHNQINLDNYVLNDYQQFKYRGDRSEFFILKNKWRQMTTGEKDKLKYFGLEVDNTPAEAVININKYVTVVNPVRSRELWKDKSLKPIDDQYKAINSLELKATWLMQNDVLKDNELIQYIKSFDQNQELGLFLEVSKDLAYKSRVYFDEQRPWYDPGVVFLSAYSRQERLKLIDKMMDEFKNTFGYTPKSAGAWWIDSYSQQYLENKYGIKTMMIVADQKTTDNYGVWGQWWGVPYHPDPKNILVPGNAKTVVIQWAQRDLEKAYEGEGKAISNFSLQANDYTSLELDTNYFEKLANQYLEAGQITVGLETGMESVGQEMEYEKQLKWLKDNQITSVTMNEFGDVFGSKNPDKVVLGDWVMTANFRENKSLNERTDYYRGMVFRDFEKEDTSSFLNRIYKPENLVEKTNNYGGVLLVGLAILAGLLLDIKAGGVVMVGLWVAEHLRYTVVNGEKMIGILLDSFRLVGINFKTGLINTDLSNLVAKTMLKLNFEYDYLIIWIIVGLVIKILWKKFHLGKQKLDK